MNFGRPVCEHCGSWLVVVDSVARGKPLQCVRHLDTPDRCPGTSRSADELRGLVLLWAQFCEDVQFGFSAIFNGDPR